MTEEQQRAERVASLLEQRAALARCRVEILAEPQSPLRDEKIDVVSAQEARLQKEELDLLYKDAAEANPGILGGFLDVSAPPYRREWPLMSDFLGQEEEVRRRLAIRAQIHLTLPSPSPVPAATIVVSESVEETLSWSQRLHAMMRVHGLR